MHPCPSGHVPGDLRRGRGQARGQRHRVEALVVPEDAALAVDRNRHGLGLFLGGIARGLRQVDLHRVRQQGGGDHEHDQQHQHDVDQRHHVDVADSAP